MLLTLRKLQKVRCRRFQPRMYNVNTYMTTSNGKRIVLRKISELSLLIHLLILIIWRPPCYFMKRAVGGEKMSGLDGSVLQDFDILSMLMRLKEGNFSVMLTDGRRKSRNQITENGIRVETQLLL